ncbi:MAG: hypothetical protein JSS57_17360 [Proteobacteria bacterium]|nr:hypothetical protein [Pseudomonadota bacterium]
MAFGIEYFVGASRGGWVASSERFSSEEAASAEIYFRETWERREDITPMMRRPVEVG